VGILLALLVLGLTIKSQLASLAHPLGPAAAAAGVPALAVSAASPAQASQQIRQQVQDQVKAALQSAPKPD